MQNTKNDGPKKKTLIIVRHAHRETAQGRLLDNGLSDKGRSQADLIQQLFNKEFPGSTARLVSSPKARCRETLEPLAKSLHVAIESEPLLLEGGEHFVGVPDQIDQRIDLFFSEWTQRHEAITVACSHGDWIPEFLVRYASIETEVKKGAWAELAYDPKQTETRLTLRALHQRLGE